MDLESVKINDLSSWCRIKFDNNPLTYAHQLYLNGEEIKDLIIPDDVDVIARYAFHDCYGLSSIIIPNTVISIGEGAFMDCSGVTNVTFPNNLTTIPDLAFSGCSSLSTLIIPKSMTSIGGSAFGQCSGLVSIKVEEGNVAYDSRDNCDAIIETASNKLLYGCKNTIIPNSVTSISGGAFIYCKDLEHITIPNSVSSIGYGAFRECEDLSSINLPNSVALIDSYAFYGCKALASASIGSGVKEICYHAFAECENLADVFCYAREVPKTDNQAFYGSYPEFITLHVPEGCVDAYKAVEPWKNFKEIVSIVETKYTLTYKVDGEIYQTYELVEGAVITPEEAPTKEGYDFSGWSKIPATMPAEDVTVTGSFTLLTDEDEITIKSYGKGTYCSRYDLDFSDTENLKAFIVSGYDHKTNTIWLTRVKSVPAGTGIIVKGTPGDYKVKHVESLSVYANFLVGTTEDKKIKAVEGEMTNFVLSKGEWYRFDGEITLPKGMAYLPLPLSKFAGTRSLIEVYEDNDEGTTEIRTIEQGTVSSEHDVWFTLQGQRVTNPGKGIYIRNGRKIVVK